MCTLTKCGDNTPVYKAGPKAKAQEMGLYEKFTLDDPLLKDFFDKLSSQQQKDEDSSKQHVSCVGKILYYAHSQMSKKTSTPMPDTINIEGKGIHLRVL